MVDVSWQPAFVRAAVAALAGTVRHWLYVSSCSVYTDDRTAAQEEDATLHEPHRGDGPVDWEVYGPAKVACEQACLAGNGGEHTLVARAGLIGGYGDRTDRLGYWPARVARAADTEAVLTPPRGTATQVIDVEDLAGWLVSAAVRHTPGVFNAVGDVTTLGAVLDAAVASCGIAPRFVEAPNVWLAQEGVEPWRGPSRCRCGCPNRSTPDS